MKKVLITGGAGFIGYHLAIMLRQCDYKIDLLDNFSRGVNDNSLSDLAHDDKVNLFNLDLLQTDSIPQVDDDYDCIYHFAALIGVQHVLKLPYDVLEKNIILLNNALEIAQRQKKLERFVFASTSEVYAGTLKHYGLDFPTPESTPLTINNLKEPRTSYMLSKIYGEAICLHSGLPVTIIRPHNFYGPRMGLSHVIPELMKKNVNSKNGLIDVYSVKHRRTFCYIDDAVQMIKLLAESDQTIGETYNVGNPNEEISIGELARLIILTCGRNIQINPLHVMPGSPERRCPDMSKLKRAIPFIKKYPLKTGLKKTFEWYNQNVFLGNKVYAI